MEQKKLYRSKTNKILAGVCGGIAEYTGINTTLVRVIAVVSGVGLIAYIVLALLIPEEPTE
ncbi:MAG: PspC domain-containing protein [Oscillospiraceae bacterium]|nr:PspC domain-containing protein [Oscillospiraceae bacterium]